MAGPTPKLDDAAARALWGLRDAAKEHLGLLYEQDDQIVATPTQTIGRKNESRGEFEIPPGSLRGVFHNHPLTGDSRKDKRISMFSPDDVALAKRLGVPSYLQVGNELRQLNAALNTPIDHHPGETFLSKIPLSSIRQKRMLAKEIEGDRMNIAKHQRTQE